MVNPMKRFWLVFKWCGLFLFYALYAVWCLGAIRYAPLPAAARIVLGILFALTVFSAPFIVPGRKYFIAGALCLMLTVSLLWCLLRPSNDRDWRPEYARMPRAEWHNEFQFTLHDLRDFQYRSSDNDFIARFRTENYDIRDTTALEYAVVHWPGPFEETAIGHSMLCFRFRDGRSLVFSVETRRDRADGYGFLPGIYKQFETIFVIGTEKDLFALRTNFRTPREDVYLYQTNATLEQREKILRALLDRANELYERPEFYHTVFQNCLTSLIPCLRAGVDLPWFHYSFLLNGYSDDLAFGKGMLTKARDDESLEELKTRSHLNPRVRDLTPELKNYSTLIHSHEGKDFDAADH